MTRSANLILAIVAVGLLSLSVSACGKYGKPVRSDAAAVEQPQSPSSELKSDTSRHPSV
jgi:hypothetical protein